MNGPQDVGGLHGFGPVEPEPEDVRFHAGWEGRVLGVTLAAGALGYWTIDTSRHARESLPPGVYYTASYYEIWLRALETLLQRAGEVTAGELAAGAAQRPVTAPSAGSRQRRFPASWPRAARRRGPARTRSLPPETRCAPETTSRPAIPVCPAMPGARRGS